MTKHLSIIIPCFNSAATLEAAVASCFDQGFATDEFEIVLVDDGSSDTTHSIIKTLAAARENIVVEYHSQNQGGGAARNTGATIATAPILFFLDSDDILPEGTLQLMFTHLVTNKCDGVGINTSIKFNGNDTNNIEAKHTFIRVNEQIMLTDLLQKNGLCSLYSTFMITKEAFIKTGGYPTLHGFDTQGFAWRFLAAGLYAETVPNATYLHRVHASISYYGREFQSGKVNFNWQKIFIEHLSLFTPPLQQFILAFPCADFTRNIFDEVVAHDLVFGSHPTPTPLVTLTATTPINRNSMTGLYMRLRARIMSHIKRNTWLRQVLLEGLFTYEDLVSRRGAKAPLRVIWSYLTLRARKILRVDFNRTPLRSHEPIDIVIPTIGKDFPVFSLYLEQLRRNLSHPIGTIYVVSNAREEALQTYCRENSLVFIDEASVLGYGKDHISYTYDNQNRSGWLFQQLLKLSGDVFVKNQKYIIVDSDTLIIRSLSFLQNGKSVFFESREWNQPYFNAIETLFGFAAPHPYSLTSHMMIFDVARLHEMKAEIESKHHVRWDEAYISSCDRTTASGISDYETYAQWMLKRYPNEVYTTPFYNASLGRTAFFANPEVISTFIHRAHSLSLHSYN